MLIGGHSTTRQWQDSRDCSVKSVSGVELARAVEAKGWVLLRINGSHHIYGKTGEVVRLSIPIHGHKSLKTGLQIFLMKQAGLTEADF